MPRPRKASNVMEMNGRFDREPSKRRIDPESPGELGLPPRHLELARKRIWRELSKQLPIGVGREADRFSFEILVTLMLKQRSGIIGSGELGALCNLLTKFGLTPVSRANVAMPAGTARDGNNPFSEFSEE